MLRLTHILFESIIPSSVVLSELTNALSILDDNSTINAIRRVTTSKIEYDSYGYQMMSLFSPQQAAELLYSSNKKQFDKIISGATRFKFLSAGVFGLAFDLGEQILKIEKRNSGGASSDTRTIKSLAQLWGQTELGKAVPMIYDSGTMSYQTLELYWTVMEKFETIPRDYAGIAEVLDLIARRIEPSEEKQKEIADKLRLSDDWYPQFVRDIKSLKQDGFNLDLHSGNIGIRRSGGVGYLVVFD